MSATSMRIGYRSETATDYANAINSAETLKALRAVVDEYAEVAKDAQEIVSQMDARGFTEWRKGLKKERRGVFAGQAFAEKFGAVMIPELMLKVSIVAGRYGVPFGVAYIRLKEHGQLDKGLSR